MGKFISEAQSWYQAVSNLKQSLDLICVIYFYTYLLIQLGLVMLSKTIVAHTGDYSILVFTACFSFGLYFIYELIQEHNVAFFINYLEECPNETIRKNLKEDDVYGALSVKTWGQAWKIEPNKKTNALLWVFIISVIAYAKRNSPLVMFDVVSGLIISSIAIHFLWEILTLIEPRDKKYWAKMELFGIPRCGYRLISKQSISTYDKFLAKVYGYTAQYELNNSTKWLSQLKFLNKFEHSFVIYPLINEMRDEDLALHLNKALQNYTLWEYFLLVNRVINGKLNIRRQSSDKAKLIAQAQIKVGDDKFNAWQFALMSNNINALKSLHYKGIERQIIEEQYPLVYYYSHLNAPVRSFLETKYSKKWDCLVSLGGWSPNYLAVGKIPIFEVMFKYSKIEDLSLNNKRIESIVKSKFLMEMDDVELLGSTLNKIRTKFKVINSPLLMILHKLKKVGMDHNLIANFLEESYFGSSNLFTSHKLWSPMSYLMLREEAQTFVKTDCIFSALVVELVNLYGQKKALKIIRNSLSVSQNDWVNCLDLILRIRSTPHLFSDYKFPLKVKDILVLIKELTWAQEHSQNPEMFLNQEELFRLDNKYLDAEDDLKIVVPILNKELIDAGRNLKVCVSNGHFLDKIIEKKSFIVFIKKQEQIKGVIEFTDKKEILQAKGAENKNLDFALILRFKKVLDENI